MKNQSITLKVLNELLSQKHKYYLNKQDGYRGIPDNSFDGEQGEYNEFFKFYRHPEMPENVFLRETYNTDSYGDNEHVVSISFVEGKAKTITIFEPI